VSFVATGVQVQQVEPPVVAHRHQAVPGRAEDRGLQHDQAIVRADGRLQLPPGRGVPEPDLRRNPHAVITDRVPTPGRPSEQLIRKLLNGTCELCARCHDMIHGQHAAR